MPRIRQGPQSGDARAQMVTSGPSTFRKQSSPLAPSTSAAASINSAPLPSLLLGLRHASSSRSVPAVSSLEAASPTASSSTVQTKNGHDSPKLAPARRQMSTLSRSVSTASLAPPTLSLATSSAVSASEGTRSAASEVDLAADTDDDSDASSGFEGLLERVGVHRRGEGTRRSGSPKGKERALDLSDDTSDNSSARLPIEKRSVEDADTDADVDADDDQLEKVDRIEGQPDPREMLRAQLRRSESVISVHDRSEIKQSKESELVGKDPPFRDKYTPRRYYILSSAGKLIYTTEPDDEEASGYVGVMQAIISIFADERDRLRYVDAGEDRIAFLLKAPIYLVCSSNWGEPEAILRNHLDYLYLQVLSIVTQTQLNSIFSKRSNFDLRRLLEGTEGFFSTLIERLQTSLAILTNSIEVFRISASVRANVSKALTYPKTRTSASSLSLLYALVVSHDRLVTLVRPTAHSIHPTDLQLLLNTISSSASFREPDADSWIPICLPRFNNRGFLYAYISFVSAATGVVLISAERDAFEGVKAYAEIVKTSLKSGGLVHQLENSKSKQLYSLGELAIPGLRHFLFKSKTHVQATHPAFEGDYEELLHRNRLVTLYQRVHTALHIRGAGSSGREDVRPAKLIFFRTEHEAILGWTTSKFELYLVVSPLMPKTAVVSAARAVTRWIQPDELFLTNAASF